MPGVTRVGDMCTGHSIYLPRQSIEGSGDVFVNGKGAHRVGDMWAAHPHVGVLSSGSSNVFVNGKALGRCGDSISCGSKVSTCSSDVFANG